MPAPGLILTDAERVRIVLGPAAFGERAEQDEPGDAMGIIDREFDASRPAFGGAEQHDAPGVRRPQHGADIFRGDVDAGRRADPIGQPDAAAIEHDQAPELHQ